MHKSKLFRLLKVLNPEEFKNFPKFIKSPFFNTNKKYLPFYMYLRKHYPDFDSPKLSKEVAFKKLFPGKSYNYHVISNLMSGFATLTEEYLLNIQFQKESFQKKKTLARAYSERKDCYDLFHKYNESLIQEVESRTIRDETYYRELRVLYHDFYFHPITKRQQINQQIAQKVMDYLDIAYAQTKLYYLLEIKTRENVFGEKYLTILEEDMIRRAMPFFKQKNPICFIYLKMLQLQESGHDDKLYESTKTFFFQHISNIGKTEKVITLLYLLNYCIRLIKKNRRLYATKCLELFKVGLSSHIFIEKNRMMEGLFSNIVSIGIICQAFDWTKNFILEYQHFLDEEERKDTTMLSFALLHFAQKNYITIQKNLLEHSFDKPLHIIKAKVLLIRTYFEQFLKDDSYYDLVLAQSHSFEKFIRRNKIISEEHAIPYLNFIQFTRQVANAILDRHCTDDLIQAIQSTPALHYRDWLLAKIQEK